MEKGWRGMLTAFDDKSLHYGYHIFGFLAWKAFGLNGTYWMLLFVTLHALNSFLSFYIFHKLYSGLTIRFSWLIAFSGCLLFAVSPYQTEPVVWNACIHYLFATALLLAAFIFVLKYLEYRKTKFILGFYAAFLFALFTLEITFAFPVILLVFFFFWPAKGFRGISRVKLIAFFALPSVVLILFYFSLSYLLRGSVVGHYGASAHLNFSIPLLMANLATYGSKILLLSQFYSYEHRNFLFMIFEKSIAGWALFSALCTLAILFFIYKNRMPARVKVLLLLFCFSIVAFLPVLNLFVTYIVNVEGDRFIYFPSIFCYQVVSYTLLAYIPAAGLFVLMPFLFYNVKYQQLNVQSWVHAKEVNRNLIKNFRWWHADRVYLLNNPDNYNGVYMFRCFPPDNLFAETLLLHTGKDIESKVFDTYQYNMISPSDSVTVEIISDKELKVTFAQWGNWWWYKGIGAAKVSNDKFDLQLADEWGHSYKVLFHQKIPGTVYLYQCGGEWREVNGF